MSMRELFAAYRATTYWVVDGDREIGLRIDDPTPELIVLFDRLHATTAAFLTAYNPFSRPTSLEENERAQAALKADLSTVSVAVLDGYGQGADDNWPSEPSFLAVGITRDQAEALGRKYEQNAIVWIEDGGVPCLLFLG